jgi:quinol monooxygenase YgiN
LWAEPIKAQKAPGPRNTAVCAIVRAETRPGLDEEFEAQLRDLAFHVEADEDACTAYVVTRALGSRHQFAVHARFENWAAFRQHAETEHLAAALPRLTRLLASPVSLEIFFEV